MHNDLNINEHWKLLREKLSGIYEGLQIQEYGPTTCGEDVIRGPHVGVLIPAEEPLDPKGFQKVADLVNEHLCDIEWDGTVKYTHMTGIYNGHAAEMFLLKKGA